METEKEGKNNITETVLGCLLLGSIYSAIDQSFVSLIIFGSCAFLAVVVYILQRTVWKSIETLEDNICKRLDKEGFQHEKQEGILYVTNNESRFRVQLANSYNSRIKRLFVIYDFGDDDFDKITMDGWYHAANTINIHDTATTFVVLDDHFCCCYQAAIGNAGDFMKEFARASHAISGAMEDYGKLYPYLERDYPNKAENKTSIGFKQN